jgi:hypothetical protein
MKEQFCEQFRTDLGETLFDYRREALECVALAMQEARDIEAALTEFLQGPPGWRAVDARRKAGEVLNILVQQRTGLVVQRGASYDFIHPSFREYLAAAAIVQVCKSRECVWQHLISRWQDEHWREAALLALGVLSEEGRDVTHLLKRILRHGEEGALYFVGVALGEQVQVSPNFANGVIGSLLDAARRMASWFYTWQRPSALTILAELRTYPLAANGLLALACDERVNERVRTQAAKALGRLSRIDEAVPILLALARDMHADAGVRQEAVETLVELDWADNLLALARDERVDAGVRQAAVESLRELGQADDLLILARDERVNVWMRLKAAKALGELGRADEAVSIVRVLAHDERADANVRGEAQQTIRLIHLLNS